MFAALTLEEGGSGSFSLCSAFTASHPPVSDGKERNSSSCLDCGFIGGWIEKLHFQFVEMESSHSGRKVWTFPGTSRSCASPWWLIVGHSTGSLLLLCVCVFILFCAAEAAAFSQRASEKEQSLHRSPSLLLSACCVWQGFKARPSVNLLRLICNQHSCQTFHSKSREAEKCFC